MGLYPSKLKRCKAEWTPKKITIIKYRSYPMNRKGHFIRRLLSLILLRSFMIHADSQSCDKRVSGSKNPFPLTAADKLETERLLEQ